MNGDSLHLIKRPNIKTASDRLLQTGLAVEYFDSFEQKSHDFHTHEFVEMLFVIKGEFRHITADHTYDETTGGLTILNYNQYHSLRTQKGPVELMNLYWNPSLYPVPPLPEDLAHGLHDLIPQHPILGHRLNRIRHLDVQNPGRISSLLQMIFQEQEVPRVGIEGAIQSLFSLFLIELCRAVPSEHGENEADFPRMKKVRNYLDKNYTNQIRLDDLCELSGFNSANLCRRFKSYTGMSTGDYLKQRRLAAAIQQLRISDKKVLTICHDCGFPDVSRFNRNFRQAFDSTPSEYRKRFISPTP